MEEPMRSRPGAEIKSTASERKPSRVMQVELLLISVVVGILAIIALRPDKSGRLVALFAVGDVVGMWAVVAGGRRDLSAEVQPRNVRSDVPAQRTDRGTLQMRAAGKRGLIEDGQHRGPRDGARVARSTQDTALLRSSRAA